MVDIRYSRVFGEYNRHSPDGRGPDRNPLLQDAVRRQTDRILDRLGFKILLNLGIGEACVGSEIEARDFATIARHDRLQHVLPPVGAMNVAGAQRASLQIAELVEDEQRVITSAFVMAVPDAHLLLAMGRAHARIHVEHNASWRAASMNAVDPLAGKLSESEEVLSRRQPLRLEAPHLARRGRTTLSRLAADNPTHRRIMAQPVGVVHVLVSGKPTEDRLPQHPDYSMPAVLAGSPVCKRLPGHPAEERRRSPPNRETGASICGRIRA
jgi:hypothetical protein